MTEKEMVLVIDRSAREALFVAPTFKDAVKILIEEYGVDADFPKYSIEELKKQPFLWWFHHTDYGFPTIKIYE